MKDWLVVTWQLRRECNIRLGQVLHGFEGQVIRTQGLKQFFIYDFIKYGYFCNEGQTVISAALAN
jgi:hypothetical protein